MIENAEEFIRSLGFSVFRVRYIGNGKREEPDAKLQVDLEEMGKLGALQSKICGGLRAIGFREITIDPDGYRPPRVVR
jgi:PP-loop superfamily ATP-utilizing enzyme